MVVEEVEVELQLQRQCTMVVEVVEVELQLQCTIVVEVVVLQMIQGGESSSCLHVDEDK